MYSSHGVVTNQFMFRIIWPELRTQFHLQTLRWYFLPLHDVKFSFDILTVNAFIDGAELPFLREKYSKMYLKINRSVKTT